MKALLLIFTILFLSSTSFAKAKNGEVFKFDFSIYKKMKKKERTQYLKYIKELSAQLDKEKSKGKKTAYFDLQQLLLPYADAASYMCFNGGMAYSVDGDESTCSSQGPAAGDASLYGACTGGGKRCSIALGLSSDFKAGCWTSSGSATKDCERAVGNDDGLKRLEEQLNQCVSKTVTDKGLDCGKLTSAVTADTAELDSYCTSGRWKPTCERIKGKVAKIRDAAKGRPVDPNAPSLDVTSDASGCGPAEHKVIEDAFKKQTGQSIDPKWAALIGLTEKGCRIGDFDFLKQMEKFGACPADGSVSLSDVQNNVYGDARPTLRSAVEKLKNGGAFNNAELGQFKDYFGISPTEFSTLFCKSGNSKDFLANIEKMAGSSVNTKATDMANFLLDGSDKAKDAVKRMASGPMRDSIEGYFAKSASVQGLKALFDNATRECKEGIAVSCEKRFEYQKNYNDGLGEASKQRQDLFFNLIQVSSWTTLSNEARAKKELEVLKANMSTGYGALETAYAEHARDKATGSGGMSVEGQKQRDRFKQCSAKAVATSRKNEGTASEELVAKSNFSGCRKRRLNALTPTQLASMFGSYYLKAKDGTQACYVATEKPFTKTSCKPSQAAIKVSTGAAVASGETSDRPEICLEDVISKYTAYEVSCNPLPSGTPGEGSVEK